MNRMKKILSLLLCVTVVTACFTGLPASAADTNVTLRVGLTISGENAFADPKLENVSGNPPPKALVTEVTPSNCRAV